MLALAVKWGYDAWVRLLIEGGADPNCVDADGSTPLYYATGPQVVEYLVAHGAEVDKRDREGNTPLFQTLARMSATANLELRREYWAVAEALVRAGAELRLANTNGRRPIDFCTPIQRRMMRALLDGLSMRRIAIGRTFTEGIADRLHAVSLGRS